MTPVQVSGQAIGTAISVTDSTALAALPQQGLAVGTQVWNSGVGAFFTLTVSSASLVTDQVVAVSGIDGLRWIKNSITPSSLPLATFAQAGAVPYFDPWYTTAATEAAALGCTEFLAIPVGNRTIGTTSIDAKVDGGGIPQNNAAAVFFPTTTLIEAPKSTAVWYFKFRAKQFTVSTAGQYAQFGLANSNGHGAWFTEQNGTNTGKYYIVQSDGTNQTSNTNITVDTTFHDFSINPASTNVIYKIDGATAATVANTHMGNDPASLNVVNGGTVSVVVTKLFVGFVTPT